MLGLRLLVWSSPNYVNYPKMQSIDQSAIQLGTPNQDFYGVDREHDGIYDDLKLLISSK